MHEILRTRENFSKNASSLSNSSGRGAKGLPCSKFLKLKPLCRFTQIRNPWHYYTTDVLLTLYGHPVFDVRDPIYLSEIENMRDISYECYCVVYVRLAIQGAVAVVLFSNHVFLLFIAGQIKELLALMQPLSIAIQNSPLPRTKLTKAKALSMSCSGRSWLIM